MTSIRKLLWIAGYSYNVKSYRETSYVYCSKGARECPSKGTINRNRDPESLILSEGHNHQEDWLASRKAAFYLELEKKVTKHLFQS